MFPTLHVGEAGPAAGTPELNGVTGQASRRDGPWELPSGTQAILWARPRSRPEPPRGGSGCRGHRANGSDQQQGGKASWRVRAAARGDLSDSSGTGLGPSLRGDGQGLSFLLSWQRLQDPAGSARAACHGALGGPLPDPRLALGDQDARGALVFVVTVQGAWRRPQETQRPLAQEHGSRLLSAFRMPSTLHAPARPGSRKRPPCGEAQHPACAQWSSKHCKHTRPT